MPVSAYLFLELAIIAYLLGFCWEHLSVARLRGASLWRAALALALFWFAIDEVAIRLGLWEFPARGSMSPRLFALPLEECALFLLHTFVCLVLLNQYSSTEEG